MKRLPYPKRSVRLTAKGESYYRVYASFYVKRDGPGKRPGGTTASFDQEFWGRDTTEAAVAHLRRAGCFEIKVSRRTTYKAESTVWEPVLNWEA